MSRKKLHEDGEYRLTLRLSPELAERLKHLADVNKRSLNAEIAYVLEHHADYIIETREVREDQA
jgi:predicted transcriptional regulator